ncbi:tyrosine-type recombinase/integrase [Niveibacterium sp.]|uniref:tyrosine-type recombinase/integrase n=1 Tax=Niveibacterium sp. TaxID=2017444 RepID=UPI0035B08CE9
MGNLKDVQIRNWVAAGQPVAKADGDGLTFTLSARGTAAWVLRYRVAGAKSQKEITLGRYPDLTLAGARKLAAEYRVRVQQGTDVAAEKRRAKNETARAWTVQRLADAYFDNAAGKLSPLTIKGRRQQLRDYAIPKIGRLPAAEVSGGDIVDVVEAAASKSGHVARLILIALREVFAFGVARHVMTENPCAHVKASAVVGTRKASRTRIMLTEAELRALLPKADIIGRTNGLMLRILLATGVRIGELIGAEWSHVDFERRQWTIPAANIKGRKMEAERGEEVKDFVIPLSDPALGWFRDLEALAGGSRFVLPIRKRHGGVEGSRPMSATAINAAFNRLADEMGEHCRRFTPHDLRSTARSHLGALGVDLLIAERCLNHALGGLVAVYDQHDYMTERRRALDLLGRFLVACESGQGWNVVQFGKVAAA